MPDPGIAAPQDQLLGGRILKFLLGFVVCVLAFAGVLALVHGPMHLTNNPTSVAAVLASGAIGLCLLTLIVAGVLKRSTGRTIARSWWPTLLSITVLSMITLYVLEVTAL